MSQAPWAARPALGVLVFAGAAACAPSRDVVASEVGALAGGSGGSGGSGNAAAGAGGNAGAPSTPCARLAADAGPALALFDFEAAEGETAIADVMAQRMASVEGSPASVVAGPEGCGQALAFGNDERYLLLPDDPIWNLSQGSIDAWFFVPAAVPDVMGIISRDQYGDHVGHFSVFLLKDRTVLARLQQSEIGAPTPILVMACTSDPLSPSSWAHFGFNFGSDGAELFVNGELAARTGAPGLELGAVMCGATAPSPTIPDLPLPWVVGASVYASMDVPNVREFPFTSGAVDNLRISAVQRDFAAAF